MQSRFKFSGARIKAMNIKRLHLGLGLALGSSLLLSGTLPAQAQVGNQSDVTGAMITTSDIAGGAFAPSVGGGTVTAFTSPGIAAAVNQAAASLNAQVSQGTLPVAATSGPTTSIPATVLQALQSVLTGAGDVAVALSSIESALANAPGAPSTTLVRNLLSSLQGLTAGGTVSPAQLVATVEAYNALIDASSGEFLGNPQPELLAIQSALSTLVNASLAAR